MASYVFVLCLAVFLVIILAWGFKHLPDACWQFVAAVPRGKLPHGGWSGANFTYYGLIIACSTVFSMALAIFLLGAISVPLKASLTVAAILMAVCIPASRIMAGIVEKKRHTFTVGGALFLGILLMPWVIYLVKRTGTGHFQMEVLPVCAALAIAYGFGEGLGRLACLSFGCCYGKPMSQVHPLLRRVFGGHGTIFHGETKKIAYASGLEGEKVFPVQAVTTTLYCASALISTLLFLKGHFAAALVQVLTITQIWRIVSETLRHDYRGDGEISAYQIMMIITLFYSFSLPFAFPMSNTTAPSLVSGWLTIWSPGVILALQAVWMVMFVYYGKSRVTRAVIAFNVQQDRI